MQYLMLPTTQKTTGMTHIFLIISGVINPHKGTATLDLM
jgi:hypothetical protein